MTSDSEWGESKESVEELPSGHDGSDGRVMWTASGVAETSVERRGCHKKRMSQLIQSGHRDYKSAGSVQASCSAAAVRFVRAVPGTAGKMLDRRVILRGRALMGRSTL